MICNGACECLRGRESPSGVTGKSGTGKNKNSLTNLLTDCKSGGGQVALLLTATAPPDID